MFLRVDMNVLVVRKINECLQPMLSLQLNVILERWLAHFHISILRRPKYGADLDKFFNITSW